MKPVSKNIPMTFLTIFAKQLFQFLIIHVFSKVFDVNIGEFPGTCPKLSLPLFSGFKSSNKPVGKNQIVKIKHQTVRFYWECQTDTRQNRPIIWLFLNLPP